MNVTQKVRINKYDNLKGLAMLLIIFGHLDRLNTITPYGLSTLYLIDLPIFFFVAGYFSKTTPDQPLKSFKRLMVPYFVFCLLIELFRLFYVGSMNWKMIFLQATVALWFLVGLFIMKMLLPILDKFRYPIITTLLFALLFGLFDINPNILGLTRTFAYLPIFLLGFYYNTYKDNFTQSYPRLYGFIDRNFKLILVLVIMVTAIVIFKFSTKFFMFKVPYVGRLEFEAMKRLIVLVLAMVWVLIFNRIMTNRDCFLTKIGRNSMAVYVLHIFLFIYIKPIWATLIPNPIISFAATLVLTLLTGFVLSRDVVTKYFNKLNDGVYNLVVKPA